MFHPDQVEAVAACPNIITAALAEAVVIELAATDVEFAVDIVVGVTSNGPVASTPEKAVMALAALVTPLAKVKV